jgi:ribosome biogenesis protein YTM1
MSKIYFKIPCSERKLDSHFLTAAYDGHLRAFDLSRTTVLDVPLHTAPITSFTLLPSPSSSSSAPTADDGYTVLTASQDLTAQITRITLPGIHGPASSKALATLHLHTAPLSSVSVDSKGKQVLTSSWDGLIGLWDTSIPSSDEIPEPEGTSSSADRKKRRKVQKDDGEKPKRKAPLNVLKSHVGRVSKVVWTNDDEGALSCGFDSTVRTWDVENGVCTQTIVSVLFPSPFVSRTPNSPSLRVIL